MMTRIAILGGGIIARTCALALLDRDCEVTLVAEPDPAPPSWGNAGHIAAEQITPLAEWRTLGRLRTELFPRGAVAVDWHRPQAWLPWSLRFLRACTPHRRRTGGAALRDLLAEALPAWQRLAGRLGNPPLLDERGIVKLFEGADAGARAGQMIRQDHGSARAQRLDPASLASINALLASPAGAGVHFPGTAHVRDPRRVLDALHDAFLSGGGRHHVARALPPRADAQGVTIETSAGRLRADRVVVAAGVRSAALLPGLALPMIAERGYHLEWEHGGAWTGPNLAFEDRSLVVTRFGARLRATSIVEFTTDGAPPDPRKWRHIERHVRELGLPVRGAFAPWHGSRPTLPDYLPALGPLAAQRRIAVACGHNHLGLTLAASTAERLAAYLLDDTPLPAATRPERFGRRTR